MNNQQVETDETAKAMPNPRPRLAIVVSHPIQHFCPMYRSIASDGRVELLVVFAESGAIPRFDSGFGRVIKWQDDILDHYSYTIVNAEAANRSKAVLDKLRSFAPDVIYVHGYNKDYARAAMRWANRNRIPVLITTDSELLSARPWHIRVIKRLVLPWTFRYVDLVLTVGDENERYFEHYGVDRDRFHRVSFSIDSSYYDKILADRVCVRRTVRQRLGIPNDAVVILSVGKLIPRKRQADLVKAFSRTAKLARKQAVLLIAGDGPDRESLEKLAEPLGSSIKLLGFVGVDELPEYYVAADIYAHASSFDPHPLAISEAIYCGLPVVVSDRIGSTGPTDDVQVGRNGWVYRNGDVEALSEILSNIIDDPQLRERAGQESRALGELHSSIRCGSLFIDGALRALSNRRPA